MKKLGLSIVAATAMIFSAQNVTAQTPQSEVVVEQAVQQKDDYTQIEVQELPTEVQQAVERDYEGALITEAYVKEKEGERKFKLKVRTPDGEDQELYADEQGNWIDKDKKDE